MSSPERGAGITGHVFIATSVDGFIAREDGGIDWLLSRDAAGEDHGYEAFTADIDGIVMGRGSFETVLGFDPWPYRQPVVVMSRSLERLPEAAAGLNVELCALTPAGTMAMLAERGWRRVYVDGGRLVQSFLREGLIEDIVLTLAPVLIGSGRPLFGALPGDVALEHVDTRSFPSGLVQLRYRVLR